jgi:hypothetical protein
VSPPASTAPRQTASITPPRPPQITTAPASASRRPTVYAQASSWGVASLLPTTAIRSGRSTLQPLDFIGGPPAQLPRTHVSRPDGAGDHRAEATLLQVI